MGRWWASDSALLTTARGPVEPVESPGPAGPVRTDDDLNYPCCLQRTRSAGRVDSRADASIDAGENMTPISMPVRSRGVAGARGPITSDAASRPGKPVTVDRTTSFPLTSTTVALSQRRRRPLPVLTSSDRCSRWSRRRGVHRARSSAPVWQHPDYRPHRRVTTVRPRRCAGLGRPVLRDDRGKPLGHPVRIGAPERPAGCRASRRWPAPCRRHPR